MAVVLFDNKYSVYYDFGVSPIGIGLATDNIVSVSDEETIPNFEDQQFYTDKETNPVEMGSHFYFKASVNIPG
jgi:hypothetical protein